jgi:hypothetical protein
MLLAIMLLFTAASIHGATMLCAMWLGACMRMITMLVTFITRTAGMMRTMIAMRG